MLALIVLAAACGSRSELSGGAGGSAPPPVDAGIGGNLSTSVSSSAGAGVSSSTGVSSGTGVSSSASSSTGGGDAGAMDGGGSCGVEACAAGGGPDGGPGSILWAALRGGSGQQAVQQVVVDAAGDIFVVGNLFGPDAVDLGCGPLDQPKKGMFVAKMSRCGACIWSRAFGGAQAGGVAVGAGGSVVVTGSFGPGTADVAGQTLTTSASFAEVVAALGPDGTLHWAQSLGGDSTSSCTPNGVAVDPSGNVLLAGTFTGSIGFGSHTLTSGAGAAAFVGKLAPDGTPAWVKSFGPNLWAGALATDATGRVLLAGSYEFPADFGCGTLPGEPSHFGQPYVVAFDPSGGCIWSRWFPTAVGHAFTIATDASSRIYVGGSYQDSIDLGGGPIPDQGAPASYVAALDTTGALRWGRGFSNVFATPAVDAAGNVFLAGDAVGPSNLGVGSLSGTLFAAGLGPSGSTRWVESFAQPSPGGSTFGAIAAGAASGVVIAGGIGGTIDLACGPLTSTSSEDVFLAALAE